MSPVTELAWWSSLTGDDLRLNTQGDPPYDADRVADLIEMRLGDPGNVLDVGCGTGRLAAIYQRHTQAKVVGFDPSPNILAAARRHAQQVTFTPSLPDGPFGGAYSVTVFQHLPHRECARYVTEVVARLAPGGRFVFQYVEGDEDTFLSHQASEATVRGWCADFDVTIERDTEVTAWRWATVVGP